MRWFLACCTLASMVVEAEAAPTAETLYNDGQAAYDRQDFPAAVVGWQQSYKLSGAAGLLFNIAQAYRQNGQCKEALFTYQRFLALDPNAEQRTLASEFVHELDPQCGQHDVLAPAALKSGRTEKNVGLVVGGAGIAVLFAGIVTAHHGAALADGVTHACASSCDWSAESSVASSGHRFTTVGWTIGVVGLASILAGGTLYYLGGRASSSSGSHVDVAVTSATTFVTWEGRW